LEWAESYIFELPVRHTFNGLVGDDGAGGHICSVLELNQEIELGLREGRSGSSS
jgi:hypothetical protein